MTDWRIQAEALFGEGWQYPLADVAAVATRTAQRWAANDSAPDDIRAWLAEMTRRVPRPLQRAYGAALVAAIRQTPDTDAAARALLLAGRDIAQGDLPRRSP